MIWLIIVAMLVAVVYGLTRAAETVGKHAEHR